MVCSSSSVPKLISFLVLMSVATTRTNAQAQTCASNLVPCAQYLNSTTTPPNSCCDPIKKAVADDLPCLCNLYKNPAFLTQLGINVTQALRLPQLCGIPNDTTACDSTTTASAPTGSTRSPPAGSTPPGNGAGKIASSGVFGLFLVSACMMLF